MKKISILMLTVMVLLFSACNKKEYSVSESSASDERNESELSVTTVSEVSLDVSTSEDKETPSENDDPDLNNEYQQFFSLVSGKDYGREVLLNMGDRYLVPLYDYKNGEGSYLFEDGKGFSGKERLIFDVENVVKATDYELRGEIVGYNGEPVIDDCTIAKRFGNISDEAYDKYNVYVERDSERIYIGRCRVNRDPKGKIRTIAFDSNIMEDGTRKGVGNYYKYQAYENHDNEVFGDIVGYDAEKNTIEVEKYEWLCENYTFFLSNCNQKNHTYTISEEAIVEISAFEPWSGLVYVKPDAFFDVLQSRDMEPRGYSEPHRFMIRLDGKNVVEIKEVPQFTIPMEMDLTDEERKNLPELPERYKFLEGHILLNTDLGYEGDAYFDD